MTVPVSELQGIAPSAIIELYELQLNTAQHGSTDIYRFHSGSNLNANGALVWNGNTYDRFPVETDGFEYAGQGSLPQPKVRVSNIMGTISALLLSINAISVGNDLIGAKFTRIRTLARYIDAVNFPGSVNPYGTPDPTAEFPREIYFVSQKSAETRDYVEFTLSAAFDLQGVRAPKRQAISNVCQWVYKSTECGYVPGYYYDDNDAIVSSAAQDVCGKRLSSCQARFGLTGGNQSRTGSVTLGSNVLTLASTVNLAPGQKISGTGIATGVTITAITSSTTATMSAVATATTNASVSGTVSSTAATMTVTSASGLAAGATVTGTYLPSGTSILSISGTTITLNNRPYSINRSGTVLTTGGDRYTPGTIVGIGISTAGLGVGMKVFGSNNINTTITSIGASSITLANYGSLSVPLNSFGPQPVNLFFLPASPSSATYTFAANNQFSFTLTDYTLPFGSYPGVGTYIQ